MKSKLKLSIKKLGDSDEGFESPNNFPSTPQPDKPDDNEVDANALEKMISELDARELIDMLH
jgi:hypothetical protein